MAKAKYKYNPHTLTYDKVERTFKDRLLIALKYLAVLALISTISITAFNALFESPKEVALRREVQFLNNQIDVMNAELDTLNSFATDLRQKDDDVYRNIFGADRYPSHLRKPGIGGVDRYKKLKGYDNSDEIVETKKRISKLQRQLVAQSKSLEEVFEMAQKKTEMLSSIPAIQPVRNEDLRRVASGYGRRIHPIYKIPKMHYGLDFSAGTGTEIYATGDGVVDDVQYDRTGFGKHVIIRHGYGYETLYAHMSEPKVRRGQKVKRGQVIGLVGNTGTSVGSHLHYEVRKDGERVNPGYYFFNDLTPEQYEKLLKKASEANQSLD